MNNKYENITSGAEANLFFRIYEEFLNKNTIKGKLRNQKSKFNDSNVFVLKKKDNVSGIQITQNREY